MRHFWGENVESAPHFWAGRSLRQSLTHLPVIRPNRHDHVQVLEGERRLGIDHSGDLIRLDQKPVVLYELRLRPLLDVAPAVESAAERVVMVDRHPLEVEWNELEMERGVVERGVKWNRSGCERGWYVRAGGLLLSVTRGGLQRGVVCRGVSVTRGGL